MATTPTQAVNRARNERSSGKECWKASWAARHPLMPRTRGTSAMSRVRCASHAKGRIWPIAPTNVLAGPGGPVPVVEAMTKIVITGLATAAAGSPSAA